VHWKIRLPLLVINATSCADQTIDIEDIEKGIDNMMTRETIMQIFS
jgi:hypothetical protein